MAVKKWELRCGQDSGGVQILMHAAEPIARFDIVTPVGVHGGTLSVRKLRDEDAGATFVAAFDQPVVGGDVEVYEWMLAPEGTPTTWGRHTVGVAVVGGVLLRPPPVVEAPIEKPRVGRPPKAPVADTPPVE